MQEAILSVLGSACLLHATYLIHLMSSYDSVSDVPSGSTFSSKVSLLYLSAVVEVGIGVMLVMVGFILHRPFQRSRLLDTARTKRYDTAMHTGKGFIHFNNRACNFDKVVCVSQKS